MRDLLLSKITELIILKTLDGDNEFKIRALENVKKIIENTGDDDIERLITTGELMHYKGIGVSSFALLKEIFESGDSKQISDLRQKFPKSIFELFKVRGLGAKKIKILYEQLQIASLEDLTSVCESGGLADVKGFGLKIQENILKNIRNIKNYRNKYLLAAILPIVDEIICILEATGIFEKIVAAGCIRRRCEVVEDICIIIVPRANVTESGALDAIRRISFIDSIISATPERIITRLNSGIECDFIVINERSFYAGLLYYTGSSEHYELLKKIAATNNIKILNDAILIENQEIQISSETEIYEKLFKIQYIEPELREDCFDISAAVNRKIPELINESDIRGMLHIHTTETDGTMNLLQIYEYLKTSGYEYAGISDHSKSSYYVNGLSAERLLKQIDEIRQLNEKLADFKFLAGVECDILADGSLDYQPEILKYLDFTIISVHSHFQMTKTEMTGRICQALKNRYSTILGHPTGRLLLNREAYSVDIYEILDTAAGENKIIEINAAPDRLDLDWRFIEYGLKKNVKFAINPDAHRVENFANIKYGVYTARKGMFSKINVINALNYDEIR